MIRNSFQRDLIEDPFFAAHRNHMMSMGSMFQMTDPFGAPQITDARIAERERRSQERRVQRQQQLQVSPFGMGMMPLGFGGMLANMDRMMSDMHSRFDQPMRSPPANGANFVQSSFVSYSNNGNGSPRVYQSSVTRRAQGGAIETQRSERDTTTGVEKVEIGHKIGQREHKVEKSRNRLTGENNVNQEFINIDEEEAGNFNQEFEDRVRQTSMPVRSTAEHGRHRVNPTNSHGHPHMQSITAGHTNGSSPHRSTVAGQRPDSASHRPTSSSHRPVSASHRQASTSQRPVSASQRPVSASQRPVSASQRPVSASQRPVSASQRPATTSHRSDTSSHRSDTSSYRPSSASQRAASATHRLTSVGRDKKIVGSHSPSSPSNRPHSARHTSSVANPLTPTYGASSRHLSNHLSTQHNNSNVGHSHSPVSHTQSDVSQMDVGTSQTQDDTNQMEVVTSNSQGETSQTQSTTESSSSQRPSQRHRTPLLILPPSRYRSRREYK